MDSLNKTNGTVHTDIPGWFDFSDIYRNQVDEAPIGKRSIFVEIGAYLGKSTHFLASAIIDSGKPIDLYVVDTWEGSTLESLYQEEVAAHGGSLFESFMKNVEDVSFVIKPLRMDSIAAAKWFPDRSVDFIFHDGCHEHAYVQQEISVWRPKVRRGGTIAGHDWPWDAVRTAVQKVLPPNEISVIGNSWLWEKRR